MAIFARSQPTAIFCRRGRSWGNKNNPLRGLGFFDCEAGIIMSVTLSREQCCVVVSRATAAAWTSRWAHSPGARGRRSLAFGFCYHLITDETIYAQHNEMLHCTACLFLTLSKIQHINLPARSIHSCVYLYQGLERTTASNDLARYEVILV